MLVSEVKPEAETMFGYFVRSSKQIAVVGVLGVFGVGVLAQQSAATAAKPAVVTTASAPDMAALVERGKEILKATHGVGQTVVLERYDGVYAVLSVHGVTAGSEAHLRLSDFFVVIDGEATVMTGGTMVDRKENAATGEVRGTDLVGGTAHVLHKGDVLYIPAGMPHRVMEAPGQAVMAYVVKVEKAGN